MKQEHKSLQKMWRDIKVNIYLNLASFPMRLYLYTF